MLHLARMAEQKEKRREKKNEEKLQLINSAFRRILQCECMMRAGSKTERRENESEQEQERKKRILKQ